jgi:hypothetical protein
VNYSSNDLHFLLTSLSLVMDSNALHRNPAFISLYKFNNLYLGQLRFSWALFRRTLCYWVGGSGCVEEN